jgi:tetratricopeptide (TPR) repeat protein
VHPSRPEDSDLTVDPAEPENLFGPRGEEVERARARIRELCGRPRLELEVPDDELASLQREIERLGYAGVGSDGEDDPEPLDASPRPSPHAMVAAYEDYMEGRKLFEEGGDPEQAAARLERAVAANPENHKAWFTLGLVLQGLGRFERAADGFARVLPHPGGERIPARLNLAVCLYNLGRRPEAIRHLEEALSDTIGPPGALDLLVRMLEEEGRFEEAERQRDRR